MSEEAVIQAAVRVILGTALRLIQAEPHQWSPRPCQTCRAISAVADAPFGCSLVAKQKENK